MNTKNALNRFVVASTEFKSRSDGAAKLHKSLDIVLGLSGATDMRLFDGSHFVVVKFFSAISDFMTDDEPQMALVEKIVCLLKNLANCPSVNHALSSVLRIGFPIISLLHKIGFSEKEPIVVQGFQLVDQINIVEVEYVDTAMDCFLQALFQHASTNTTLSTSSIGILSTLCRNNEAVRSHIKQLPNVKQLLKTLVPKVNDLNLQVSLQALSVLVFCRGKWARTLFQRENVLRTFALVVRTLLADEVENKPYAANLLQDLLQDLPSSRADMLQYDGTIEAVREILKAFVGKKSGTSCLLQSLCALLEAFPTQRFLGNILSGSENLLRELLSTVTYWIGQKSEETLQLSVHFLKLLLKETNLPEEDAATILTMLADEMKTELNFNSIFIKGHLQKLKTIVELLIVLGEDETLKVKLVQHMTADVFKSVFDIVNHYQHYREDHSSAMDVALLLLSLLQKLRELCPEIEGVLQNLSQNDKFAPFLAKCLASKSQFHVQQALHASRIVPSEIFSQALAELNARRSGPVTSVECASVPALANVRQSLDCDINDLVHKIEEGFGVSDLKMSDVIKIYQCQILSLQKREQKLHEILDAKTATLQTTEQLLSEHRQKKAFRDAEATKVHKLLWESETRSERSKELADKARDDRQRCEEELKTLTDLHSQLLRQSKELQDLFTQEEKKNAIAHRNITNLKNDFAMMSENSALLSKHNDELKERLELATDDNVNLTLENKQFHNLLKESEAKVNALQASLTALERLEEEHDALKLADDQLKEQFASLQQEKTRLEEESSGLSALCCQHQATITSLQQKLTEMENLNRMIYELSAKATAPKQ